MIDSWAVRLAPEPFQDFLPYTSVSALKVIHAKQVLGRALEIARHTTDPRARARESARIRESLERAGLDTELVILNQPGLSLAVTQLTDADRRLVGERVLKLYFHQLLSGGPLFLDLRPRHFSWDAATRTLGFYPSSLWYEPNPDFMARLRALYFGFYHPDRSRLARGIELFRWQSTASAGFEARIERLLRSHFGSAGETRFEVAHFRSTFDAIFAEVAESAAKLHPELTFLGVELVGLYLTLEALNVPLDARAAFEQMAADAGVVES